MTRREGRTVLLTWLNGLIIIKSTSLGWVNSMASWIAFVFFTPREKHKTRDCDRLQDFADEVLMMAKPANREKKPEDPKGDFPMARKEVNYIFGGPDSYEPKIESRIEDRAKLESK
jgi:hypothetical protein